MNSVINSYLTHVKIAWEAEDGRLLASLLGLGDRHSIEPSLAVNPQPEKFVERYVVAPLIDLVSTHLRVLHQLQAHKLDYMEAFNQQALCTSAATRLLGEMKDENWCLPIMYRVCLDLRLLAQACEKHCAGFNPGRILERAADSLMPCFRVCANDSRAADQDTKRIGILNVVNQMIKIYFRINKLDLCKPVIRAISNLNFKDAFPISEQVTYKYYVGRRAMFDSDYTLADQYLSFALQHCPARFTTNKRMILVYLIPVKMLRGYRARRDILERYDLLFFDELAYALRMGNVRRFQEVVRAHESFLISTGIYLLIEKCLFIVYRNLFKRIYLVRDKTHQLDLQDFYAALQFAGVDDITMEETHCIVANLIYENKIKGYLSHTHNKLVVSKQNPFPPLTTTDA